MYEAFYGFSEKPFSLLPDPSFLFLGKEHSEAFSMLEYGVLNQAGFTVITGEVGSGKTTLIRHLLNQVEGDVVVGLLSNTQLGLEELLQWVLLTFDQEYEGQSKVALFDSFTRFLIDQYAQNKRVVLIIDEAQNLQPVVLEELRMLSNINADKHQVLQVILVGQPQLRETLKLPELLQFSQRVSVNYHLPALRKDETRDYILHRIHHAGAEENIFTREAMDLIYEASEGIPRSINVLCDTALVYAFADQKSLIGPAVITSVLQDKEKNSLLQTDDQPLPEPSPVLRYPPPDPEVKKVTPFDKEMARQLFSRLHDK